MNQNLIILWCIRELGEVSGEDLFYFFLNDKLLTYDRLQYFKRQYPGTSIFRPILNSMEQLYRAGLIEPISNDVKDFRYSKYRVGSTLEHLQGIFQISLSQFMSRTDSLIEAYPIFREPIALTGRRARIFVAMPFRDDLRHVYEDYISRISRELGITCKRGDEFFSTNMIMDEVWSSIYHAQLCICDCTGRNANVFYELGIAHTLGRKTVLIAQSTDDIPFDIQHIRAIIYENNLLGMKNFEEKLRKTIITELELKTNSE